MLITMLTAMYMMVRVVESIGTRFSRQPDPLPYLVSQPLPWQVHSVSHSRRSSKAEEFEGLRRNSIGVYRKLLKWRRPPPPSRPTSGSSNRKSRRMAN
uniref:Secreted protein n=1 Tax=Labrus bergylta TaxID=56723 RepID=A0A3Q3GVV0_9LABR